MSDDIQHDAIGLSFRLIRIGFVLVLFYYRVSRHHFSASPSVHQRNHRTELDPRCLPACERMYFKLGNRIALIVLRRVETQIRAALLY